MATVISMAGLAGAAALHLAMALGHQDVVLGDASVDFEVERGDTAGVVVDRLVATGVVIDSPFWDVWIRLVRPGGCLQAGRHTIPAEAGGRELFAALCEVALAPSVRVTVPEGTNLYQLADQLSDAGLGDREAYLALAFDPAFVAGLGIQAPSLEGYLAPDTYEVAEDAEPAEVLRVLATEGARVRSVAWAAAEGSGGAGLLEPAAGFDMHALLTIASIVEEEAQVADERPLIARVIYNRLRRGMPLQCDPTCVYGQDIYDRVPARALCRDPASTHSTYVLPALPPTPITNPGRAAIEAVLAPAADPEVLYFVAMRDGSGRHVFARTRAEHERNVDRYLR